MLRVQGEHREIAAKFLQSRQAAGIDQRAGDRDGRATAVDLADEHGLAGGETLHRRYRLDVSLSGDGGHSWPWLGGMTSPSR